MDPLPPIPTPPAQRWREFRIQALPLLTFVAVLGCIVVLWQNYVVPTSLVGEVESVHANIISAVPATIKEVKVQRFQRVAAGEEIAVISTTDAETIQASIRAVEADLKLMRARMQLDIERNTQSYELARLEFLKERTDVALERVNAYYYELEAQRLQQLITNASPIVSRTEYEIALRLAAAARTNVIEKEAYLAEKEKILPTLAPRTQADEAILEAIKTQEEELRATTGTVTLRSPIDGIVTSVLFLPGQKIVPNLPIAVVSGTNATRIIGYVRKPYSEVPKPGDIVQVRRQSFKRETAQGTVLEVARQLEPISTMVVPPPATGQTQEMGLPFAVTIPVGLPLLPGEAVDLVLQSK